MNNKIIQSIIAGILGTGAMTLVTLVAPIIGMPKMSAPSMLSMMSGFPIAVGWLMHFLIGIIYAFSYTFLVIGWLHKISGAFFRGIIFGIITFIFAQIIIATMGVMMGGMPPMEGSMALMMIGSIVGHIVFGIIVVMYISDSTSKKSITSGI